VPLELGPESVIVTIDGPAGTGKSTVAHRLAKRLGLEVLDTGAMYRAAALVALERHLDPANGAAIAQLVESLDIHFDWAADPPAILIGSRDVSRRIREPDIDRIVSIVAKQRAVRQTLVRHQRRIAQRHPRLVTEGRDQGSVVFPEAPVRFYLDAAPEVRAARRVAQLQEQGLEESYDEVLRDIRNRDEIDSCREEAPLRAPDGAIRVDTGELTLEGVVDAMEHAVRTHIPDAFSPSSTRPH
jgi:CMP/dCMP kinase